MNREQGRFDGRPDPQLDVEIMAAVAAWSGRYDGNDWQIITAADALGWGRWSPLAVRPGGRKRRVGGGLDASGVRRVTPLEGLAGRKQLIGQFCRLRREGAFCIS